MEISNIQNVVEKALKVELTADNRTREVREVVDGRIIFTALCFLLTKPKLKQLGSLIHVHHSSIVHYKKLSLDFYNYDKKFFQKLKLCVQNLSIDGNTKKKILRKRYFNNNLKVKQVKKFKTK